MLKRMVILSMIVILFILIACDNKQKYLDFSGFFSQSATTVIDTSLIAEVTQLCKLKDSYIIIDKSSKAIHRFNPASHLGEQIGRTGQGPGEYLWPYNVKVLNDSVMYFTDLQSQNIIGLNARGKQIYRQHFSMKILRFCLFSPNRFVAISNNVKIPGAYILTMNVNEPKLIFKLPNRFIYTHRKILGGGVLTDQHGNIFFAFASENKIYKFSPDGDLICEMQDPQSPFYKQVNNKLYNENYKKIDRRKRYDLIDQMTVLVNMYALGDNYFLVKYVDPGYSIYYEMWTYSGSLVGCFFIENKEEIIGTIENKIVTVKDNFEDNEKFKIVLNTYILKK